jgi:hypothetical protein
VAIDTGDSSVCDIFFESVTLTKMSSNYYQRICRYMKEIEQHCPGLTHEWRLYEEMDRHGARFAFQIICVFNLLKGEWTDGKEILNDGGQVLCDIMNRNTLLYYIRGENLCEV